ncbi:hypothetical protein MACK_000505 [Theileria orientalis]|uniref:Uncharacterized protein n=1 Tax=Theileria orientalis TaxID=68886 RepID=A0A976MC81_THEOR|nr:hypothetical protein MACK_000505 [Theileria orientalis]
MSLKRFMVKRIDSKNINCGKNLDESVNNKRFNEGLGCKVREMYHYPSPGRLAESSILINSNDFARDLSGEIELNGLNTGSIENELVNKGSYGRIEFNNCTDHDCHQGCNNHESADDMEVVIQTDNGYHKDGCIFSSNEFKPFSNSFLFSSYTSSDHPSTNYTSIEDNEGSFSPESELCIKNLTTYLNLVLMLFSLLVPLCLHMYYQYELYNSIMDIKSSSSLLKKAHDVNKSVLEKLTEFENFFFTGVSIYVIIQLIGSIITYSRYNLHLHQLYKASLKNSKDDLVNNHKDDALKRLNSYFKSLSIDDNVTKIIGKNLVESFGDVSYRINSCNMRWIWDRIRAYKFRSFGFKIWVSFAFNVSLSILVCLFVYYKRFRLWYSMPLDHFKNVSNLYWNIALNYEGFALATFIFAVNLLSWTLLLLMNRNFPMFIYETQYFLKDIMDSFNVQVSGSIWDREVSFLIRNL